MKTTALPLNSPDLLARLRRAREDRSLSQQEVAAALGIARTTLVAIEAGERPLRPEELLSLAHLYREPLDILLRTGPEPGRLAAQFRLAAGRLPQRAELREAAAELQRLGEDYVELERLLDAPMPTRHPAPVSPTGNPEIDAEELAESERGRLNLGDGPLPHLRDILENDVGLRVFSLVLPSRIGGLFAVDEELGACIAMNSSQRWERQRWSLAHEYAHFLTRRDQAEITIVLADYKRIPAGERLADAFARNLLLPSDGVRRRYRRAVADAGKATATVLLEQADWWGVSFEAYVRRLEGLRLIRAGTFESFDRRGFAVEEGREILGMERREADARLLPRRFRLLAVRAYTEGLISEERLARLLREDRLGVRATVVELTKPLHEY